jgi:hypothetical protein
MNWLKVNAFLLALCLIAAGSLWILGFSMWSFDLAPDDHPALLTLGAICCLFLTYYVGKWMHVRLSR